MAALLNAGQRDSLNAFLGSIDGRTDALCSAADDFRNILAAGP